MRPALIALLVRETEARSRSLDFMSSVAGEGTRLLAVLAGGCALLAAATSNLTLAVILLAVGGVLAPTAIVGSALLDDVAPPGTVTEAFTVMIMGIVAGTAMGAGSALLAAAYFDRRRGGTSDPVDLDRDDVVAVMPSHGDVPERAHVEADPPERHAVLQRARAGDVLPHRRRG